MTNRLRIFLRATTKSSVFCLSLLSAAWLGAQPAFFNFSYNGPTSLPVNAGCESKLQGNVPNPVVTSTVGANITMSMFDPVLSGFQYNDPFQANTTAHVFWFVKDDQGHEHTYEYFISFVDQMPPTFDLTGIFSPMFYSSVAEVPDPPNIPVTDNCTPVVNQTYNESPRPPLCESGTFTRTWTASDTYGNTATYTQTIIILRDSLPPVITGYPQDGSAPCEALATAYPAWLAAQRAVFNATDPSGIESLSDNAPASFPPGCKVPLTVRFKAVDNCQFQQNVFVTFSTSDTQGPVVVKPPKDTVAYCTQDDQEMARLAQWISTKAYSMAKDTCSEPLSYRYRIGTSTVDSLQVVNAFLASLSEGCNSANIGGTLYQKVRGSVTVGFFTSDACGNETFMGNATFGAIDTLRPSITGINVTEQCGGGNDQSALQAWINAHGNASVTEDCSNFTWTNFTFTTSNGQSGTGNFNVGPYPSVQPNNCTWFADVTFRATDDCGNSNTITLRWSIIDTQEPVISGLAPNITVYCPNPLPTVPDAVVTDNCDADVAVTFARVYLDSLCDGSYTVRTTWIATDDCGNSSTALQDIFVRDTTRPVFTLVPASITMRCDTFALPPVPVMGMNIQATDLCSPVVSITTATQSFQNPDPAVCGHYSYNIARIFTATDQCGNTQTASQTISVIDNLGPVPGGVLDSTALCSALVPFPMPSPIAVDACSGITAAPLSTGSNTIMPGNCTGQYTVLVHWSAVDVCGNETLFDQTLHVIDTVAPVLNNIPANITVECDAIPDLPDTASFNGTDNCGSPITIVLAQTEIRDSDSTSCAFWTDYVIRREWTSTDDCGNSRTYTQLIQIEDTTPPAIVPPASLTIPNDPGDCGTTILLPMPLSITDVCSGQQKQAMVSASALLVPGGPGPVAVTPVADMVIHLAAPNMPPFRPAIGTPLLRVILDNADAEGPEEFLNVYDEDNNLLGTANTNSQCGDKTNTFTLTALQLNKWLADGTATFYVRPNGSGANACNAICAGGQVTALLEYAYMVSGVDIDLSYSLDGGAPMPFPPTSPSFLSVGTHTLTYTATDCAGNSATASMQVTVNDVEPPHLTPPADFVVYTGQNNCEGTATLPFPTIVENCRMSASLNLTSAILPLHFENDPNVGLVASDVSVPLSGIIPNAVGTGLLRIRHRGDNAQLGEFFNVYDEQGNPLGSTGQGTVVGECSAFFETVIPVTAAQINTWGTVGGGFGSTSFYLETNRDLLNYSDFISNCGPLQPNGTDGISQVQVILEYSYAVVDFSVKNAANQTVVSGNLNDNLTTASLTPGNYTVMYSTIDHVGLPGMATYRLWVRDTVKPKAICNPTHIVSVNPSGGAAFVLSASSINNGSFDNCTPAAGLSFSVSPAIFSCNQAGSTVTVTMTVTDTSGNFSTCQTLVGVTTTKPVPTFTPVCENGILQLFANPPSASPFTYQWAGPNNYQSFVQNPIVSSNAMAIHNGTYCVTITGATGCTSFGCVTVNLAILGNPPSLTSNGLSFCPGQSIELSTASYQGQNVSYQWLVDSVAGLPGGPVPLAVTTTPAFSVGSPPPGQYVYYVKVFANGCNTAQSNSVTVTVHPKPPAAASPATIRVCECQSITLQSTTPSFGGTLTYAWTGPGGFTSNSPSPLVANCAVKAIHEGIYTLVTTRNGCNSNPATVTVNIDPKPPKPTITGNLNACAGQTVNLVCNIASGFQWIWTSPNLQDFITTTNVLQIPNVNQSHAGNWTVIVRTLDCYSDASNPVMVQVHEYPVVSASTNSPICKDSLLQLSANSSSTLPLTWCWTFPSTMVQCAKNLSLPNGASGLYTVVATTSFGCSGTATVSVTNVVPATITGISNNAPACCDANAVTTLSATLDVPNPPVSSYLWTGPPAFGTSTLPNPTIAGACTDHNGPYTLVVKDAFGCPSLPATTEVNIQLPPAGPTLTVSPPQPVCEGTPVLLSVSNPTPDAKYLWTRPGGLGDTLTAATSLSIPAAFVWHSGAYFVQVVSANGICVSALSNPVVLTVNPIPATPIIGSDSPVCEGGTLNLTAQPVPGVSYQWTGPASFNSMAQNPSRSPVTLNMAGTYTLKVTKDGCTSSEASLTASVVPRPMRPTIVPPPARICISAPVTTFLNILDPVNGMEYEWVHLGTGLVLQGPSTLTNLNLNMANVLALGPGAHQFAVTARTADHPHCTSDPSLPITIAFDTIPTNINAFAGIDRFACVINPIVLQGTPNPLPGMVTGMWTKISGPTANIDNATSPNGSFLGIADSVYTFQWSLSNGACTNFSRDTVVIRAQRPELANAGADIFTCSTSNIKLNAVKGITAQGFWTQSLQQAQILGIVIDNPDDPQSGISGVLNRGQNYTFTWNIGNDGCGFATDNVTVFIWSPKPYAGADQFVCSAENCANLSASSLASFEGGRWSSNDISITFNPMNTPNTKVCGLKQGKNIVYWTTNNGVCGNDSRDTVEIHYELFPTAVDDIVPVPFGSTATFNVLANDILPATSVVELVVTVPPASGTILDLGNGNFTYRPSTGFTGSETMTYRIRNTNCAEAISFGTVTFTVGAAGDCFVPSIITPNNDGYNDFFVVPTSCVFGGEGPEDVEVTIFNQWGDAVYHAKPYNNDWGGTYNSEDLPAGTYFFVVRIGDNAKPLTGFLLIQR